MDIRGQLTADFLLATLLLLIILGALTNTISSGIDAANNAEFSIAKAVLDNVARSVNSVYTNHHGHYTVYELPGDFNYNVTIHQNSTITVNYRDKVAYTRIIPRGLSITMRPNETYRISNINGTVNFTRLR